MILPLALLLLPPALSQQVPQHPLRLPPPDALKPLNLTTTPKLHGRFLHLTDLHPDPHYLPGSRVSSACHDGGSNKKKKKKNRAKWWGTPGSDCDSPPGLINITLEWIEKEWADKVDFVIWTGDSARHDNDRNLPRSIEEIYASNRYLTARMQEIFTSRGIPVIPSLGNNDVWPHNTMSAGPSSITAEYASIWTPFVPLASYSPLQHGAYFSSPLVSPPPSPSNSTSPPLKLAALSLNTLFFFESNKVVSGCSESEAQDPGSEELAWMEATLEGYRREGWKVWVTGHVPPRVGHWWPECYKRYGELALRYQDIIVGHLYGHLNFDHFFFIDAADLDSHRHSHAKSKTPHDDLLRDFSELPPSRDVRLGNYAVVNVAPSVVPTYYPSVRVWTYNTSSTLDDTALHPSGPSCTNTLWTPLGYAQFYMPTVGTADASHPPRYELEYVTYPRSVLLPSPNSTSLPPVPLYLLPPALLSELQDEQAEDPDPNTDNSNKKKKKKKGKKKKKPSTPHTPYELEDLTLPSWLRLARRLAKHKKLWRTFLRNMYVGTGAEDE